MILDRLQKSMGRVVRWLDEGTLFIAASLLAAIVVIDGASVVFRYVLGSPLSWSEEVMRYCNVWLSFIGAITAFARREHMTVDFGLFGTGAIGRVVRVICLLATLVVAWYMVTLGIRGTISNMAQVSPSAGIMMAIPYAAVPIAGAGIFFISLYFLMLTLRGVERRLPAEDGSE